MIYFDNAATTGKKPDMVVKAVAGALRKNCVNPGRSGYKLSLETAEKIYEIRQKIADFFGCEQAENVAFTLNCTHALNCVIKGNLKSSDHAVVSTLEHNAVMRPLAKIKADFDFAEVSLFDDEITVKNFAKKLRKDTKMVICTAASNVLGKKLPIERIGELCKERNICFVVDGAQLAGIEKIDMQKMNIDFLCVAPHKGLYAPMGIGILLSRKPLYDTLIEGGTGSSSINFHQPFTMPEMIESGTVNVPAIFGIGAGIDFINSIGTQRIAKYEGKLCTKLFRGLQKNSDIRLYTKYSPELYAPVIPFNLRDIPSEEIARKLNENNVAVRAGLHCAPTAHKYIGTLGIGVVRISPSIFNSENEVERFLSIINKL